MKVTKERLEEILPDWDVHQFSDDSFEISRHSPAGEEVIMTLQGRNLGEMAAYSEHYYDDFDADDHAAVIYHLKHYGTPDERRFYSDAPDALEDLVADSKTIDNWYYEVGCALRKAWQNEEDDGE